MGLAPIVGEKIQSTSLSQGIRPVLRSFSDSLPLIPEHQLVRPKRPRLLQMPGPIRGQTFWQSHNPLWQPTVVPPQQHGHQGELQLIDSISLQEIGREPRTSEKYKSLHTQRSQTAQPLVPAIA